MSAKSTSDEAGAATPWIEKRRLWGFLANATLRLCIPVGLVAVGVGALVGHFFPEHVCSEFAEEEPHLNRRVAECLLGTEGGDGALRARGIVWPLLNSFWCGFPFLLMHITWPSAKARVETLLAILLGIAPSALTICFAVALERSLGSLLFLALMACLVCLAAVVSGYRVFKDHVVGGAWLFWSAAGWTVGYAATSLEMLLLQRSLTVNADIQQLFLVRFLLHSSLWWVIETVMRHSIRLAGTHASLVEMSTLLPFKIVHSTYGWYLIFALNGVFGNVYALIGCLALHRIAVVTFNKSRDMWLLKFLLGRPAAEALIATRSEMYLDAADKLADLLADCAGIALSGSLFEAAHLDTLSYEASKASHMHLTFLAALIIALPTRLFLFLLAHHLHQSDISSLLPSLSRPSHIVMSVLMTFFLGVDVSLRLLGTSCLGTSGDSLQICNRGSNLM